jgi:hypothetical protein
VSVEGNLGRENPCPRFFRASDKEHHGADGGPQGAWRRELEAWDTAMVRAPSMPVNPTNVALQGLQVDDRISQTFQIKVLYSGES